MMGDAAVAGGSGSSGNSGGGGGNGGINGMTIKEILEKVDLFNITVDEEDNSAKREKVLVGGKQVKNDKVRMNIQPSCILPSSVLLFSCSTVFLHSFCFRTMCWVRKNNGRTVTYCVHLGYNLQSLRQ